VKPRIVLSMIVRNAAPDLPRCLGSVRAVVDEMVLADTGSSDDTVNVARSLGARVIGIPWENDFAKARNFALAEVWRSADASPGSGWILVLDADEMLDATAATFLDLCLRDKEAAGFAVPIRNYLRTRNELLWDRAPSENDCALPESREFPVFVTHENIRLFRSDPDIYFSGRIHESVGPRILETGRKIASCGLVIHHFGLAVDRSHRAAKNKLYLELGRQKVREMPRDAQAHFELGLVEFNEFHNYAAALDCFARSSELDPRRTVAWLFRALALVRLGRFSESIAALSRAERLGYSGSLLLETRGDALYNSGKFADSCRAYERGLRKSPGHAGLESKLGLAQLRAGNSGAGIALLSSAVARQSDLPELHDRLVQAHVWLGQIVKAAEAAGRKLEQCSQVDPADFVRAAGIHVQLGDWKPAMAILSAGMGRFPNDVKLRQVSAEVESLHHEALARLSTR
jgi:tetratricopeptide (TPR) repeat protein